MTETEWSKGRRGPRQEGKDQESLDELGTGAGKNADVAVDAVAVIAEDMKDP